MLFSRRDLRDLLIPLLLEQALAVTIGMMDTVMVSSCSEAAVSGVSLVDSINVLLINVFAALATGGAVVCSQYLGKGDGRQASRTASQLYHVVLIASCGVALPCVALRGPLLSLLFGAIEADVMDAAMIYFLLSVLSYPFLAAYNGSAALLRSVSNAKATLYTSVVMNLLNVAGNALTIYGLGWGVMGAGLATLISRMAGCFIILIPLHHKDCPLKLPPLRQMSLDGGLIRKILGIGVPNGLETGMFQFGKLLLVRMIATFGTVSIAANAVGNTLSTIHCLPGNAIGLGMITVIGRCIGAKEFDQARHYTKRLMKLSYLCMGALNIAILLLNPWIAKPFHLSPETELLARQVIAIHGAGCVVLWPLSFVFPNSLRAAGDTRYTMAVSIFSMVTFRIVFGWLFAIPLGMGVVGVWIAMQIDWVFRITMFLIRWRSGEWMRKGVV